MVGRAIARARFAGGLTVAAMWLATAPAAAQPDVGAWQAILDEYATEDGFRYAALRADRADRAALDRFVAALGEAEPGGWSDDAALAFYLNAYDALVVKQVVDRWPIASVQRVEGFFDGIRHPVAGHRRTLNELENEVIRSARFGEPRVHFALNCASRSCPPLSRTAYTARNLEGQLARQARAFVRRTTRRRDGAVEVSRIFEWYAGDFGGEAGVRAFVASRLDGPLAAAARDPRHPLRYARYDWDVNAR